MKGLNPVGEVKLPPPPCCVGSCWPSRSVVGKSAECWVLVPEVLFAPPSILFVGSVRCV